MISLPEDCTSKILSYVPLHDILNYVSTSVGSMKMTIPVIEGRRKVMTEKMFWRHSLTRCIDTKLYTIDDGCDQWDDDREVYCIPSVLERLKCLQRSLFYSHPLYDSVHELILELEPDISECGMHDDVMTDEGTFETNFSAFQKATKVHRLHGLLLRATIYHGPLATTMNSCYVPLTRYVGDILIAYFCMGHSAAGIVEGISESKWIASLSEKAEADRLKPNEWYQLFVCLHSIMLRTLPLSGEQMLQLGIADRVMLEEVKQGKENNNAAFFPPPRPFRGMKKEIIVKNIRDRLDKVTLSSSVYDFGPLGALFRGRDNVSVTYLTNDVDVGADSVIIAEEMSLHITERIQITLIEQLMDNSFHPLTRMIEMKRQCFQTRPINVRAPHLTIICND